MVSIDPTFLDGASEFNKKIIRRLASLPNAPEVPDKVSIKAQAAVAIIIFQTASKALSHNAIPECSDRNVEDHQTIFEPELHVICTTRALNLSSHPGQASLPGGKVDRTDENITMTAFRETCEEIGLSEDSIDNSQIIPLCTLRPFLSKTALLVHPVVFWLPPQSTADTLKNLLPSPDEVSSLWSYPLRAVLSSEPPRQFKFSHIGDGKSIELGQELLRLEDPSKVDTHRPPQQAFHTYSDVPWLLKGAYRLHRFRSTHQLIKGLTADVLIHCASHAFRGTALSGPLYPVFSSSQAPWDECVAYIINYNLSGAPRKSRWGDGESGDSYGSVELHTTVTGQNWDKLVDKSAAIDRARDEIQTRREDTVTWTFHHSNDSDKLREVGI